jgi:hypothetical protein
MESRSHPIRFLVFSSHEKGLQTTYSTILKLAENGLQHIFETWVERCKKCIACQVKYFENETVTASSQSPESG